MSVLYSQQPEQDVAYVDAQSINVPKAGFLDNLGIGAKAGFKETSISLFKDLAISQRAKYSQTDKVLEQDWNPTHPYWIQDGDNVDWSENLTNEMARNIWEERGFETELSAIASRSTTGGGVGRFIGGLGGAMADPVNLIPFGWGLGAGKSVWAAVRAGAITNAAIEVPFGILAEATEEVRGRDYTAKDFAYQMLFAGAVGGGFAGGGRLIGQKFFDKIEGGKQVVHPKVLEHANTLTAKDKTPDSPVTARFVTGGAKKQTVQFSKTDQDYLPNIKMPGVNDTIVVDSRGVRMANDYTGDDAVRITPSENMITLDGNIKNITKILPTIKNNLDGIENIQIGTNGSIINVKDVDSVVRSLRKKHKVKAELDTGVKDKVRFDVELREIDQGNPLDFEIDPKTNEIRNVYTTTRQKKGAPDGEPQLVRGRKLNDTEKNLAIKKAEEVLDQRLGNVTTTKNVAENKVKNDPLDEVENQEARTYIENAKKNNAQESHDMMVNEAFAELSKTPGKSVSSLIEVLDETDFADAGYTVRTLDDGTKTLEVTSTPTTKTGQELRKTIRQAFQEDVDAIAEVEARKNVLNCFIKNGLLG